MTTPFEELLLAAAAPPLAPLTPPATPPATPPRAEREAPVCPDAPVRLPLSEDEEESVTEDEEVEEVEEVPLEDEEAEAEAEADPDNTYIPVVHLRVRLIDVSDVSEMLAFAKVALESDYRFDVPGKVLLATFVAVIAFLMIVAGRC